MLVKDSFELMYARSGKMQNIFPVSSRTMKAFEIPASDKKYIDHLVKMYTRSKKEIASDFVVKNISKCRIVYANEYPLPGFMTKDKIPFMNLGVFTSDDISDYSPVDLYAITLYTLMFSTFASRKSIPDAIAPQVAEFIFAVFMRIFKKRAGLGGYRELIPKLHLIISAYVHIGMFGFKQDVNLLRRLSSNFFVPFDSVNLDYDFTSVSQFLNCINENSIVAISNNRFSNEVINRGGVISLPMFEDVSRFFATLTVSSIGGTRLFSGLWSKMRPDLFQTLVNKGETFLLRSR